MTDRYPTLLELSAYAGRGERYLRDLIRRGELKCFRASPKGKILVRPSWYDEFVEERIKTQRQAEREAGAKIVKMADHLWNQMNGERL